MLSLPVEWRERASSITAVVKRVVCVLGCIVACPRGVSAADPNRIELRWSADDECSSAQDVLNAVAAQRGDDFDSQTRIRAQGELRALDGGEYDLSLSYTTTSGARDERQIHGESCAAVTKAAALVLALALDPGRAELPERPPPLTPLQPSAAAAKSDMFVGLLAVLDTPILGEPAFGGGLRLGWRFGPLELSASFQLFSPAEREAADVTMRLTLWSVDVGACYLARMDGWSVGPCGRFEVGRLAGTPRGAVDEASSGSARMQAATLGGALRVQLSSPVWLGLDAAFEWVARRPQFDVTGAPDTIAHSRVFGARLTAGPMLVF
jgi:hypothetical protein